MTTYEKNPLLKAGAGRRRLTKLNIDELSSVDRPAQAGALAVLMKRAADEPVAKRLRLTSAVNGHSHHFGDTGEGGYTSWQRGDNDEHSHDHPYVVNEDGSIVIGEADGHTHEALDASFTKSAKPAAMTKELQKKLEDAEALLKSQGAELEIAKQLGALSDAEKAFYNDLSADDQTAFLKMGSDERSQKITKSQDADPVEYTAKDGTEFRKSAGAVVISLAKRNDELAKQLAVTKASERQATFRKRADSEFGDLAGEGDVKAAIVEAVEGIADENVRKSAFETLTAANAAMTKNFEPLGASGEADSDASKQLDNLAKAYAKEKEVSFEKAYTAVLETKEGIALYQEMEA